MPQSNVLQPTSFIIAESDKSQIDMAVKNTNCYSTDTDTDDTGTSTTTTTTTTTTITITDAINANNTTSADVAITSSNIVDDDHNNNNINTNHNIAFNPDINDDDNNNANMDITGGEKTFTVNNTFNSSHNNNNNNNDNVDIIVGNDRNIGDYNDDNNNNNNNNNIIIRNNYNDDDDDNQVNRTKTRTSYTVEKKKEVTEYAREHGRNAAARHFKIDRTMIGRWVKASNTWDDKVSNNSKRIGSGQKAHYPEAEKQLHAWICEQKDQLTKLTHAKIQAKMREILKQSEMERKYPNALNNFKGSARWVMGFLKRNNLPICRKSKFQKARTKAAAESFKNFRKTIIQLRLQHDFTAANMFNMDKVPVWFDETDGMVVNSRRKRISHNNNNNNNNNTASIENCHFTIILTCAADGTKMPPICIFRGTQMPPGETVPAGVLVWFQENGLLTAEHLKTYADILHCMRAIKNNNGNEPALFVHNSYNGQLEESVVSKFQSNNFLVAMIPEGLTGICQPLNVIVLRSFKENLRKEWQNWKDASLLNLQPKITEICDWVKNAWEEVSPNHIVNAFKRCLISNPLESAENDKILEELNLMLMKDQNLIEDSDNGESNRDASTSNTHVITFEGDEDDDSDYSQDASLYYLN